MARVTYSALITALAGSIAGTTFQQNVSGAIARQKPFTCMNPSQEQTERQIALVNLVALWSTLSLAQKTAWNDLAAAHLKINDWGNPVRVSGYQWFLSYNLIAYTLDEGPWLTPVPYELVDPVTQFTLSADATKLSIDWASPESFPGYWALIYATLPMRQGNLKIRKATYVIKVWSTTNVSHLNIKDWYEDFFDYSWADFFNNSECSIIVRMKNTIEDSGYCSPFTSALIQL